MRVMCIGLFKGGCKGVKREKLGVKLLVSGV